MTSNNKGETIRRVAISKAAVIREEVSPQQQQAPPPEPQQIGKGQTPDQVKAALGQPDKIVNLGTKQIWVYKDLKVTFVNGQVSDVQ